MFSTDSLSSFAPPNRSNHWNVLEKTPSRGSSTPAQETQKKADAETALQLITIGDQSKLKTEASSNNMSSFQPDHGLLCHLSDPAGTNGANNNINKAIGASTWRLDTSSGEIDMGSESEPVGKVLSNFGKDHTIHVSSVSPGPVDPSKDQLTIAYGYAIRREDGAYTRLLRADDLRGFNTGVPPTQESAEGLIVLPSPGLPVSEKRVDDPAQYVTAAFVNSLPKNRPSHLDLYGAGTTTDPEETQRTIDKILAINPVAPVVSPAGLCKTPRRQKIYCDKWIHEGTCAFTQLGCKYKHEMPMDKATQLSLGLSHGLPIWYKRAHSVQLRPEGQGSPSPAAQASIGGPWRRKPTSGTFVGHGMPISSSSRSYSQPRLGPANFGPIGRPAPPKYQQQPSSNPCSMVKQESNFQMDQAEEQFTWSGRRR